MTQLSNEKIENGRHIAARIENALARSGAQEADHIRANLSYEERDALDAYRHFQLVSLVGQVEDSADGAEIRWQAAKSAYAAHVAKTITAALEDF